MINISTKKNTDISIQGDSEEWSGERYLPQIKGEIEVEHIHRYALAGELAQNKVVLDIASGEGYGSNFLANVAKKVIGVDISEEAISCAKSKYRKKNLEYKVGSCAAIPLGDASVDMVVSFETIEHHTQHEEMMQEITRVLKTDGVLIISSPNKHEYSDVPNTRNPYHLKELYRDEFEVLIRKYFSNITLLGQRALFGSSITMLDGSPTQSYVSYSGDLVNLQKTLGVNRPVYFIALASNSAIPTLPDNFYEWEQTQHKIRADALNEAVLAILSSTSWKVTAPLRRLSNFLSHFKSSNR